MESQPAEKVGVVRQDDLVVFHQRNATVHIQPCAKIGWVASRTNLSTIDGVHNDGKPDRAEVVH
jgi:hypothetical protein